MFSDATQRRGMRIDRGVYDTRSLDNKVRDIITAVQLLQKQPGADASQIYVLTLVAASTTLIGILGLVIAFN